jgi:hypothetical protein
MNDKGIGIVLEDMNGKMDVVLEAVGQMRDDMKMLAKQEDLEEVKADIKTVKAVITNHSIQLDDHEKRITRLETA